MEFVIIGCGNSVLGLCSFLLQAISITIIVPPKKAILLRHSGRQIQLDGAPEDARIVPMQQRQAAPAVTVVTPLFSAFLVDFKRQGEPSSSPSSSAGGSSSSQQDTGAVQGDIPTNAFGLPHGSGANGNDGQTALSAAAGAAAAAAAPRHGDAGAGGGGLLGLAAYGDEEDESSSGSSSSESEADANDQPITSFF
eukprot:1138957-Pelagomonas_calceolata.AAC.14